MTIIALSGKRRVGKDEFSNVLTKKYGFTRIALADPLRTLCSRVLYLDPKMFEDELKDERMKRINLDFHDIDNIRKIVENEWGYEVTEEARNEMEELHGTELDTPRDCLRTIGNILRTAVDKDIWINLALHKIKETGGKIVITDARFENEREVFRNLGAVMVLIKRNDNGETTEHEFDLGSDDEYDVVFTNDGTLHSYKSEVDMWYNMKQNDFQYYKVWRYE